MKLIFILKACTKSRYETEAQGKSETDGLLCWKPAGILISVVDFRSSSPGLNPDQCHCVGSKKLCSNCSSSLHPGVPADFLLWVKLTFH